MMYGEKITYYVTYHTVSDKFTVTLGDGVTVFETDSPYEVTEHVGSKNVVTMRPKDD